MPKASEVKNVGKAAEADLKKVEKEAAAKAAQEKTIETKAPEKAAEAKAEEAKAPAKKSTAKKTAAKKPAEEKTTAKKAPAKKKEDVTVWIQYAGNEYDMSAVMEKVKAAYGNEKAIKELSIYVKPEEGMVYYVVNGDQTGSIAL